MLLPNPALSLFAFFQADPNFGQAGQEVGGGAGLLMMLCIGVTGLIGLALTVFWIWMIVDCATNEPSQGNEKVIWLLVVILLSWIGALIYFFVRRPQRKALVGR